MTLLLKATWTGLILASMAALTIGLWKAGYFEWDLEARARVPLGRQIVVASSVALVVVGAAAVPVIKAPLWTVLLVIVVAGVCVWIINSDWLPLVALGIAYPLAAAVLVGYWVSRTQL